MFWKKLLINTSFVFLFSCSSKEKTTALPYFSSPDFTPLFLSESEADKKIDHSIDSFHVQDQNGRELTQASVTGKIHIANFFFAKCGVICPKMMHHLQSVVERFKNDSNIIFMSYSVTPWVDSVPVLKTYARENQYNYPQWHLCTGNTASIYKLARQSYFAEEKIGYSKDSTEFLHTEHVVLVDEKRKIRGIYNGTLKLDMEQLEKDIIALSRLY